MKPKITDIHSKNWQINAHSKLFSERSLESVLNYHMMKNSKQPIHHKYLEDLKSTKQRVGMYVTYKNIGSIYSALQRNKPVSCVKMFSAGYYVMVKNVSTNKVEGFPISYQYKKQLIH